MPELMPMTVVAVAAFLAAGMTMYSGFGLGTLTLPVLALFLPVAMAGVKFSLPSVRAAILGLI